MGRSAEQRRAALARGAAAERLVAEKLEHRGWQVLARNWKGGGGELDLVVELDGRLRFVEVKQRTRDRAIGLEVIDRRKQAHLCSAAEAFLATYSERVDEACFLIALVDPSRIHWFDHAFDG